MSSDNEPPRRSPVVGLSVVAGLGAVAVGFMTRAGLTTADQLLVGCLAGLTLGALALLFMTSLPGRGCLVFLLAFGVPIAGIVWLDDPPRFPKDWRYIATWVAGGALLFGLIVSEAGAEEERQPLS